MRHVIGIWAIAAALAGCASMPPPMPASSAGRSNTYLLAPGDKLRITVYNEEAMTGEYAISAAGNVAIPPIGDVPATGGGVETLAAAIADRLSRGYVKDPRVAVEVLNYRPYYILGEVTRPGEFPYSVNLTVEQAIAAAGGFTYRANKRFAFIRRAGEETEHSVSMRGRPTYVLPGDTIRIGERYL